MKRQFSYIVAGITLILVISSNRAGAQDSSQTIFWPTPQMAEIHQSVLGWAEAWTSQDIRSYFGFYGPDFQTSSGKDRLTWERERATRISKPRYIRIRINELDIELLGEADAVVHFQQVYKSNSYQEASKKILRLRLYHNGWRIASEEVATDDTWS